MISLYKMSMLPCYVEAFYSMQLLGPSSKEDFVPTLFQPHEHQRLQGPSNQDACTISPLRVIHHHNNVLLEEPICLIFENEKSERNMQNNAKKVWHKKSFSFWECFVPNNNKKKNH